MIPAGFIGPSSDNIRSLTTFNFIDEKENSYELNISEDNWPVTVSTGIEKFKTGEKIDVVFIALHGPYGEDGTVQGLLELMDIAYTGSDVLSSALAMNKAMCKEVYIYNGIKVPDFIACNYHEWDKDKDRIILEAKKKLDYPCVVKPSSLGSSVGTCIVKNQEDLLDKVSKAFEYDNIVLIEKYLKGTEITCAVLGGISGEDPVALPLTEIIPPDNVDFFDYDVKYDGSTQEITPARISEELTLKAQNLGVKSHKVLGCGGMSRTDMIIQGEDLYVLETNTIPGMTLNSLYPQAAKAAGIAFPELLDRLIELALDAHKNKKCKVEQK